MQTICAIYENGAFRPVDPTQVQASDGQLVTLVVQGTTLPEPLRLATQVYEGLTPAEIDEIERIALDRTNFGRDLDNGGS